MFVIMQATGTSTTRGLAVVLFAGLCFFVFSPAFNLATNDQWHLLKKGVPHLVVYTAFFYFYLSGFVIAVCVNIWLLYRPIASVPASTMEAYLRDWNGGIGPFCRACYVDFATVSNSWVGKLPDLLQLMLSW